MNIENQIAQHEHAANLYRQAADRATGTDRTYYQAEAQRRSDEAQALRDSEDVR